MDIILISSRGSADGPHWSRELAARSAGQLHAAGNELRWICALAPGETPPEPGGGEQIVAVRGTSTGFRRVQAAIEDPQTEMRLTEELRRKPADVVHAVGFGEGMSAALLWIAERMGSSAVATLRARELLCHRRTLVDEQGRECRSWESPERCVECCLTPTGNGMSPGQARLGRLLRPLGAWSPFPNRHAFVTRLDMVLAGVASADRVLVGTEGDRDLLQLAGVSSPIAILDLDREHGADLMTIYASLPASG